MNVKEQRPDGERMRLIVSVASDAARYLGLSNEETSPETIMQKVDETITDIVFGKPSPFPEDEEPYLLLGALWGTQMQRQFDWYWADVVLDGEVNEVAMISPNQEMIIFPFSFVGACINKQVICTVMLTFNMLQGNKSMNNLPNRGYENIMLGIQHVVPPYTLDEIK